MVPRLVGGRRARGGRAVAPLPRRRDARQPRRGLQRSRARRGRTPWAAPPRRAGPVPRAPAAGGQPRPRRPRLRAGAGDHRGPAARCRRAAPRPARRARSRAAGTAPRPRPPRSPAQALVEGGVWDVRVGIADDLFTAEQAARTADVQSWVVVDEGGSAAFLRGLPVHVLQDEGARGRELVSLLQRLGLRTLGDLADLPGDAVEHRLGTYGAAVRRRARGEDRALFAARTPPPELEADVAFETPLDNVEAITFSVRTTAERFITQLAHHQLVATAVRVEAESEGVVCSSRAWLHPRHFNARDLVDRVHWQLQGAGSTSRAGGALRGRKQSGEVRAPIDRVRFVPETVEPAAAHGEALWGTASDDLVERGVARVQGMVGFEAVRRPVLQGGRSPAARQALVPWGERAVDLRPVDRPWPGRVPGPAPVRVFATPRCAEVVDDAGRDVRVTDRGVVTGRAAPLPGAGGRRRREPPVAAGHRVGGAVADRRELVVGGRGTERPLPGRRRRRPRLAAAARAGRLGAGGGL